MLFGKLLVVIINLPFIQYRNIIDNALKTARQPRAIRFAVPESIAKTISKPETLIYGYDIRNPFVSLAAQLTDETFFLTVGCSVRFCKGWDSKIENAYHQIRAEKKLLTGSFWINESGNYPQNGKYIRRRGQSGSDDMNVQEAVTLLEACLPALQYDEYQKLVFTEGMPIVNQIKPLRTPLINSSFCYGPILFLQTANLSYHSFSYIARFYEYQAFAIQFSPFVWIKNEEPVYFQRPAGGMGSHMISLFEQELQVDFEHKRIGSATQNGFYPALCKPELEYSYAERVKAVKNDLYQYWTESFYPLCVTAVTDIQSSTNDSETLAQSVAFLENLKHLPLLIFTGGETESIVRKRSAKSERFPDLKLRLLQCEGMSSQNFFDYTKVFLLLTAAETRKEYSHFCWVDPDTLPYPLHELTTPDFSHLMDNRIHIAAVNRILDPSCIIVPRELLPYLKNEVLYIVKKEERQSRDYSEEKLWQQIYNDNHRCFTIHEMTKKKLLFLTTLNRKQISKQLQIQLPQTVPEYSTFREYMSNFVNKMKGLIILWKRK